MEIARVSLNPSTFVDSGLLDDADVEITDVAFCVWNYGGKGPDSLALGVEYTELMTQPDGSRKKHEQYYSAGDLHYFKPSADGGATVVPVGDKTALNSNTNAAQLFASLVKAGFPLQELEPGSCKVLKGLKVHVNRVAQPKRPGLVTDPTAKDKTVLLVSRIIGRGTGVPTGAGMQPTPPFGSGTQFNPPPERPVGMIPPSSMGSAGPASGLSASAPAPSPAPVPGNGAAVGANGGAMQLDPAIAALAQSTLINILVASGGSMDKAKLPGVAFRALMGDARQGQVVSTIYDDRFLSSCQGVRYDGATVTIA